jgi:hypothetical protein
MQKVESYELKLLNDVGIVHIYVCMKSLKYIGKLFVLIYDFPGGLAHPMRPHFPFALAGVSSDLIIAIFTIF